MLLELVTVFLGVLIALAADAWLQEREEIERELGYLRALQTDMAQAAEGVDATFAQDSVLLADMQRLLVILTGDEASPREERQNSRIISSYITHATILQNRLGSLAGLREAVGEIRSAVDVELARRGG